MASEDGGLSKGSSEEALALVGRYHQQDALALVRTPQEK